MSTGEVVLVAAIILLALAFAAVTVVLVKLVETLRTVQRDVAALHEETAPLLERMSAATSDAEETMAAARADLERFDRVLGSAEAIGGAVRGSSRVARTALSAPAIKAAGLATGTSRAVRRLRNQPRSLPRGGASR